MLWPNQGARVHPLRIAKVIVMSPFEPQNPDFVAVVRASFARQGLMQALGIELVEVAPGRCVLEAAADPRLTQQQGFSTAP